MGVATRGTRSTKNSLQELPVSFPPVPFVHFVANHFPFWILIPAALRASRHSTLPGLKALHAAGLAS
jgi:hypothetical protein